MNQTRSITTTMNRTHPHIQKTVLYVLYYIQYPFVYTSFFNNSPFKSNFTPVFSFPVTAMIDSNNKNLVRVRGK